MSLHPTTRRVGPWRSYLGLLSPPLSLTAAVPHLKHAPGPGEQNSEEMGEIGVPPESGRSRYSSWSYTAGKGEVQAVCAGMSHGCGDKSYPAHPSNRKPTHGDSSDQVHYIPGSGYLLVTTTKATQKAKGLSPLPRVPSFSHFALSLPTSVGNSAAHRVLSAVLGSMKAWPQFPVVGVHLKP